MGDMSIDEARRVMRDLFSVAEIVRIEALIDAKLSPAPVGAISYRQMAAAELVVEPATPPAATSDGGEALPPMRRSYIEGSDPPQFKPDPAGPYVLWEDAVREDNQRLRAELSEIRAQDSDLAERDEPLKAKEMKV